jgi:hypothetical protein
MTSATMSFPCVLGMNSKSIFVGIEKEGNGACEGKEKESNPIEH